MDGNSISATVSILLFYLLVLVIATKGRIFKNIIDLIKGIFSTTSNMIAEKKALSKQEKQSEFIDKVENDEKLKSYITSIEEHCTKAKEIEESKTIRILTSERINYIHNWSTEYYKLSIRKPRLAFEASTASLSQVNDCYDDLERARDNLYTTMAGYERGIEGEKIVLEKIAQYGNKYTYIPNLVLGDENIDTYQSSESDLILITGRALFLIEVKNRGKHKTLRISRDGLWTITDIFKNTDIWDNPIEQNIRHKIFLEDTIKKILDTDHLDFDIVSLIVIAVPDDDIIIKNESSTDTIIRPSMIIPYVESYRAQDNTISKEIQEKIYNELIKKDISSVKKVTVTDYSNAYSEWEKMAKVMNELSEYCDVVNNEYNAIT